MADCKSFHYSSLFQLTGDKTQYRKLTSQYVNTIDAAGHRILIVAPEVLRILAREAFRDIAFFLPAAHLNQLGQILEDHEASDNDRYVAATLMKNACEAAKQVLPSCQDTGTAIIMGHKGEQVWTGCDDYEYLSHGVFDTYTSENLRYSQMAPLSMFEEINTQCNLPAQIEIFARPGNEYHFLFLAKGGGSANKTYLYQETKYLLNEKNLTDFCRRQLSNLGTAACPPYHLALVIGGTSAEANLKTVKLASTGYLDNLPTSGNQSGRAFRDLEWERRILQIAQESKIGAQFGGKYLAHDVRVIRLPRHAASNPVGLGVSCSAHRNIKAKITSEGIFIEKLAKDLAAYQDKINVKTKTPVNIDLERPMAEIIAQLDKYPVGTLLHLHGPVIVARDIAHARIKEIVDKGGSMPAYLMDHPVYYAGPAKTPEDLPCGSFGPTTAGRMDIYVDEFQALGGSKIMLGKGNRSQQVTESCHRHGGFYLGSIGGPAAILARECITEVKTVAFPELGMEAVRKIIVKDFPAFIVCDNKGHDLYA